MESNLIGVKKQCWFIEIPYLQKTVNMESNSIFAKMCKYGIGKNILYFI